MYFEHLRDSTKRRTRSPPIRASCSSASAIATRLAHLLFGIGQGGGGGFVQLTGEVGTGKTTLSRLLLEQLPGNTRSRCC